MWKGILVFKQVIFPYLLSSLFVNAEKINFDLSSIDYFPFISRETTWQIFLMTFRDRPEKRRNLERYYRQHSTMTVPSHKKKAWSKVPPLPRWTSQQCSRENHRNVNLTERRLSLLHAVGGLTSDPRGVFALFP